jgi:hypothetical protein
MMLVSINEITSKVPRGISTPFFAEKVLRV